MKDKKKIISFENVTIGYGSNPVLRNISFSIHDRDFVGIIGPNGAGKTTLLKTIAGSIPPISGNVKSGSGRKVTRDDFGIVPQRIFGSERMPFFTVDIVMMGLYSKKGIFGRITDDDKEKVKSVLKKVGVFDKWNQPFSHLSVGQKQRVLIARALVRDPKVLLLDEPTSALDIKGKKEVMKIIGKLSEKITCIVVTHNINELYPFVTNVMYINKNEFFIGTPEEVITKEKLRSIYGTDVEVVKVRNNLCILAGDDHHDV